MDYNKARDDRVSVASAGPYVNHLRLAPADNDVRTSSLKTLKHLY